MFASRTITEHLVRGALSVLILWGTIHSSSVVPWAILITFPLALVLWRGCPTCWTIGLWQTVVNRLSGFTVLERTCSDDGCSVSRVSRVGKPLE